MPKIVSALLTIPFPSLEPSPVPDFERAAERVVEVSWRPRWDSSTNFGRIARSALRSCQSDVVAVGVLDQGRWRIEAALRLSAPAAERLLVQFAEHPRASALVAIPDLRGLPWRSCMVASRVVRDGRMVAVLVCGDELTMNEDARAALGELAQVAAEQLR
jgi:hypothetical protein